MADEIIDITRYLTREPDQGLPRGAMALWGADGERSRFALPLWRIVYLAQAERGMIVWTPAEGDAPPVPFVALDLAEEPARTALPFELPPLGDDDEPALHDRGADGLVIFLGAKDERTWRLVVSGGGRRATPLPARTREDILFLAGECAGLLFFRELARDVVGRSAGHDDVGEGVEE
jgi:hypothetical protein